MAVELPASGSDDAWITDQAAQDDVSTLNDVIGSLQREVVGSYVDHVNHKVVVVADPGAANIDDARQHIASLKLALNVEIVPGCRTRAELDSTMSGLRNARNKGQISKSVVSFIDASSSSVQVIVNQPAEADAAQAMFGDAVTVVSAPGELATMSRTSDASPHYGDARITNGLYNCSSNFTFTSMYGRFTATAGHCGSGPWYSGSNLVGSVIGTPSQPNPDVEALFAAGQTYTNKIYTDPGAPTSRSVTSASDAGIGEYVCVDGATTLAQCGNEVWAVDADWYDYSGMTLSRIASSTPVPCDHGDSGGVVYQRSGSSNAIAAGIELSGFVDAAGHPAPLYGFWVCGFDDISWIQSHLGSSVLTVP